MVMNVIDGVFRVRMDRTRSGGVRAEGAEGRKERRDEEKREEERREERGERREE
jgi:hypothetical protein